MQNPEFIFAIFIAEGLRTFKALVYLHFVHLSHIQAGCAVQFLLSDQETLTGDGMPAV